MPKRFLPTTVFAVFASGVLVLSNNAFAQGKQGNWNRRLVGAGVSTVNFRDVGQGIPMGMRHGNLTVAAFGLGDEAQGAIRVNIPGFEEMTVKVDCLLVNGNKAIAGGTPLAGSNPDGIDQLFIIVEDTPQGQPDKSTAIAIIGNVSCDFIAFLVDIGFVTPQPQMGQYVVTDLQ